MQSLWLIEGDKTYVNVTFWGVRGSIPTPGADTQRWGGNTACLEVRADGCAPLVLDCGTGARQLGFKLMGESQREVDMLFTHLHMDHVFGFPFFIPIYTPGYDVRVTVPSYSEEEAREKIARYLNGTYHPTRLKDLPSQVTFHPIRAGESFRCGAYEVKGISLNHPGGSLGYRITYDGKSVCYMTDSAPFARPGEGIESGLEPLPAEKRVVEFLREADVVIYDTMYDLSEYLDKMTWGHSYPEYAAALCEAANAKHLVLFHHRPNATDDDMDRMEARWLAYEPLRVSVAREGGTVSTEG